jgi:hypothetical protein
MELIPYTSREGREIVLYVIAAVAAVSFLCCYSCRCCQQQQQLRTPPQPHIVPGSCLCRQSVS